jgi:chemotaxis protein CheC
MNRLNDPEELAPLQEVATIAAGNAATALSKLIGQEIPVSLPSVRILPVEKVHEQLGPTNQLSTVALVRLKGDLTGLLIFSFAPDDARTAADRTNHEQTKGIFNDEKQAVLREMTNIVAGAVLNAIGTFLNLELMQSVPDSATDMLGAVLDPFTAELGAAYDKVLVVEDVFTIPDQGGSLKLIAIIDPPSTIVILEKLSNKLHDSHGTEN